MARRSRVFAGCGLVAAAALAAGLLWASREVPEVRGFLTRTQHPRVVVVTFDTLNIWYTSLFSDAGAPTPNLEQLAAEGVLFERAYTSVPITLPAHTALLTGRRPFSLGVLANGDHVPEEVTTLAEVLSEHGYHTAAFLSLGVLAPHFNLDQGFDDYDPVPSVELNRWYRTADEVLEPAIDWIGDHADDPFFVWVHFSDPHEPYVPVGAPADTELRLDGEVVGRWTLARKQTELVKLRLSPGRHRLEWSAPARRDGGLEPVPVLELLDDFDLRRLAVESLGEGPVPRRLDPAWALDLENHGSDPVEVEITFTGRVVDRSPAWIRDQYRAEVAFADQHLGKLRTFLEERSLAEDTTWMVASDHGEGLFHHGLLGHAAYNHEEQLRALWMIAGPGLPAGRRIDAPPVLIEDALPTLLESLDLPTPDDADGVSVARCWTKAGCGSLRREWIAWGLGTDRSLRSVSLYRWPWKALWSRDARPGVFDVLNDPREMKPVLRLPRASENLAGLGRSLDPPFDRMLEGLDHSVEALEAILAQTADRDLGDEERRMLESLGYL